MTASSNLFRRLLLESLEGFGGSSSAEEFLHHLSSPIGMDPDDLHESYSDSANKGMAHPKAVRIIDLGNQQRPTGNLWKHIATHLRQADDEMSNESPETKGAKLKDSIHVWNEFGKERGYKGAPSMFDPRNAKIAMSKVTAMTRGNMKTEKSSGEGILTTGLNLAPHTTGGMSGFDICPNSSTECRANCLGTEAGGNRQYPVALSSKILRTHFLLIHPQESLRIMDHEIGKHEAKAAKQDAVPGFRPNITSDVPWEKYAPGLFTRHPQTQFYDYTKVANRLYQPRPDNYHLTLSHTGTGHTESNDGEVVKALHRGKVVAMVYSKNGGVKPTHVVDVKTGTHFPIINGDKDDNTFDRHTQAGLTENQEGHGVVSGLSLKGTTAEKAGNFCNPVSSDGKIYINKD